ncbi:nucleolar protein dao-5 [Tachysurus fulvidraco]|uniref:nucleolar protein dao-5 n=1 Tax=Tachysurus fulvidraco TaxID=1234273 RepID=UPI000F4EEE21|nr:nucleolar protein dao-5 [Tachysurus fulvidraco]
MTSENTDSSEHALNDLIYWHLKENGYKKAASALKQQEPQVQTTNVKVSLNDIFKKWVSEELGKKNDEGNDTQTSSDSTTNAPHNTRPGETKTPAAASNRKRKRSTTKTGEDSDSDSSLDVEKWKSLALQLSDADLAKMDAFMNFTTSSAKSTKKRKPAQPKKQPLPKKTKAKTATTPAKTDKKPTDKKTSSICPESKMATSLLDQVATPKTAVNYGLSESDGIKVKSKMSKSHNMETPSEKSETGKTDNITEPNPNTTPCKKTKSKTNVKVTTPGSLETPSRLTDPELVIQTSQCEPKAKKKKSKKAKIMEPVDVQTSIHTYTEDATSSLTSNQSEINQGSDFISEKTPSKKAKSKKSKERQGSEDVAMSSGECEIEFESSHFNQYQTPSESVKKARSVAGSETVEKQTKKAKKCLLGPIGTEKKTESQAGTSVLGTLSSDTPSKKSKTKKALEADQSDSASENAVVDVWEGKQATKSSSSKKHHTENRLKTSKRKTADSFGENVMTSVTELLSKEQYKSLIPVENIAENKGQESVLAADEEGTPEPKKRKKKKKDKEKKKNEIVEEVPPTPPAEEFVDALPSSQKKKKKKKHREEEVLPVSDPAPEEDSPKKKKKSSKKKEHADVSEEGLL